VPRKRFEPLSWRRAGHGTNAVAHIIISAARKRTDMTVFHFGRVMISP